MASPSDLLIEQWKSNQGDTTPTPGVGHTTDSGIPTEAPDMSKSDALLAQWKQQHTASLKTTLDQALTAMPDTAASVQDLAKRTQLPADVVERNLDLVRKQVKIQDMQRLLEDSPILARQMRDPAFAKIAHDDVEVLSDIEKLNVAARRIALTSLRSGARSVADIPASIYGAGEAISGFVAPLGDPLAGTLLPENPLRRLNAGLSKFRKDSQRAGDIIQGELPKDAGILERNLYGASQSFGNQLPGLTASIAMRNPSYALVSAGVLEGGRSAADAIDAGATPARALMLGGGNAAAEVFFERFGVNKLLKDIAADTGFGKMLLGQIIREVPGEMATTMVQQANDWAVLNPGKSLDQFIQELGPAQRDTVISTIMQTTMTAGLGRGVSYVANRQQRAQNAEQSAQLVADLNRLAAADKVLQRDPETFAQFVEQAMEDGPMDQVYIDAQTLMQSGLAEQLAEVSPSVAAQLETAAATGGQVAIPVGEYAARIAPTEYAQSLADHLRTEPDGFSRAEAQEFMQNDASDLRAEFERTLTEKEGDDTFKASAEAVRATLKTQLDTAARFTPQVNDAYSSMVGNFYAVQAARMGVTPEALYQQYPLRVGAENIAGAQQFDQGGALDDLRQQWADAGIKHAISEKDGVITVSQIVVPEEGRGAGKGTAAMQALAEYADSTGQHIALSPSSDFGGNKKRLTEFYKRFGFVENKGKNRAFTTSESMYRQAQGKVLYQSPLSPDEILALLNEADTIEITAPTMTEQEIDDAQNRFLSDAPAGTRYTRTTGLLKRVRRASDLAVQELEGSEGTSRRVAGQLGPFTGYQVIGEAVSTGIPENDLLVVRVYGNEQLQQNLNAEPALTLTVAKDGELTVNGPMPGGPTFDAFRNLGWADFAKGADGTPQPGWSALTDPTNPAAPMPLQQLMPLLADVHARVREWRGEDYVGLHWSRATGAMGGLPWQSNENGTAVFLQGARGSFNPESLQITLLKNADLSTFLHESGHFFLEVQADLAAQLQQKPADTLTAGEREMLADMDALLKWFGVADLGAWQALDFEAKRKHHEKFAESFESYLFEGKAPSIELQPLFQQFRAFLLNVYKSLKDFITRHPDAGALNNEVRGVFDRMLASTEQIQLAERGRSMMPLFTSAEQAGMTAEEFAAYQSLGVPSTSEAIQELEARGLRDMRWLHNARGREIKRLQKEFAAARKEVSAEVRSEVMARPVYRAWEMLKRAVTEDALAVRLDRAALADMYGGAVEGNFDRYALLDWKRLTDQRMTADEGLHPDMVAELIVNEDGTPAFSSGDELVRALAAAEMPQAEIDALTDVRMLERYGDLNTPDAIDRAADQAVHNEVRAKMVATEANALSKAIGQRRVLNSAAKEFAAAMIARLKVRNIRPGQYASAGERAARNAEKASKAGDIATAAAEKRNQLIQIHATRAAYEAQIEVDQLRREWSRFANRADDRLVKSYDIDLVNAVRAILGEYGIAEKRAKRAGEYLNKLQEYDPQMYQIVQASVQAAEANAKPFRDMTVEEVRGLAAEIDAIMHLARRSRQMEVDGDLIDRQEVEEALRSRMEEIGVPDTVPGESSAITPGEQRMAQFRTALASLRRVESWVGQMDGMQAMGPFRKFIWNRIKDAADAYRSDKAKYLKQFRDQLDAIAPTMKPGLLAAPELNYTFGKESGGAAINEIVHAILHTGNDSNKRKLLLGRNWAQEMPDGSLDTSRWDAFINRMVSEGRITKAHFDFAQSVWDLLDSMKPLAQKTHRDVFGKYFDEVTANPVQTPFGTYAGGYVPAMADSRVVTDAKLRALLEEENAGMAFAFPSTPKGFTKSRTEYNRPLMLDLRTLAQHIDKVLLFSHMEMPVRDVQNVIKRVGGTVDRIDSGVIAGMLTPWLNRSARQQVTSPITADAGLSRFLSTLRSRAGVAAMLGNLANAAQQITGFSLAALKVRPSLMLSSTADYVKSPRQFAAAVAEASPFMAERMANEVAAMNDDINQIMLNPSLFQKGQAWTMRHGYFLQSAVDNVMSPIIWTAAYNQAVEQGLAHRDAVRLADSAVRETQGSTLPEDVSRIETGHPFVRLFTQFAGYFNMQANLLGTEFTKTMQAYGLRKGAGRGMYILMFGFLVPAIAGELVMQVFRGGPEDEDKDGEYLDDWLAALFFWAPLRNATAMLPGVGQGINSAINAWNGKPYDDRMASSPAISMLESAAKAPVSVYKAVVDDGSAQRAVRDVATLISITVGLPANLAARPIGYLTGVADDRINPTGPIDAVRGTVTGIASPESK